ncbi:MAG: hypothetical protein RLZZ453_1258 [Chlamydiota bacterium]|jgi:DNA polymerase III delta subunit
MRYQNLIAFEKHLKQSIETGLSAVFLVVTACSYERKKIVDRIIKTIQAKEKEALFKTHTSSVKELIEELNTLSLFSSKKILYFDGIEGLKKNEIEELIHYVAHPSHFAYLVLGSSQSKGLSDLYTKGKKEMIACDLSEEKPWEVKARLKGFAIEKIAHLKKQIQAEALELLIEKIGYQLPSLEQYIDKLDAYTEKEMITVADVKALVADQREAYLFDLSDKLLWTNEGCQVTSEEAQEFLFPLLSLLKTQLQQALIIAHSLERRIPPHLPGVKPFVIDKLLSKVGKIPSLIFRKKLNAVFEIELLSKNSGLESQFLLDLLSFKLRV